MRRGQPPGTRCPGTTATLSQGGPIDHSAPFRGRLGETPNPGSLVNRFPPLSLLALALLTQISQAKFLTPWSSRDAGFDPDSLVEECQYRWENGQWVLSRKTGYEYDASGSMIGASLFTKEGSAPAINKTWAFRYDPQWVWTGVSEMTPGDTGTALKMVPIVGITQRYRSENGDIVAITNEWDNRGLFAAEKSVTTFDARGDEKERLQYLYASGSWRLTASHRITRNAARQILHEESMDMDRNRTLATVYEYDARGLPTLRMEDERSRELWTYTPAGKLATYRSYNWVTGTWAFSSGETHSYNSKGERVLTLAENEFGKGERSDFSFDAATHTEQCLVSQFQDSGWFWVRKTTYLKDAKNDTVTQVEYFRDANAWTPQLKVDFTHDSGHRITGRAESHFANGAWALSNRTQADMVFNQDGKPVSARYSSWSSGNEALTGESSFAYDEHGRSLYSMDRQTTAGGVTTGWKSTHLYRGAASGVTSLGPVRMGAKGSAPWMARGNIHGPDGTAYNARGQALGAPRRH
jgi:hypothetical protein